jgi:hypothetical protein
VVEGGVAALVALCAFDAGVYLFAAAGAKGPLERVAEPVMFMATAAALAITLLLSGKGAGVLAVATLFARGGWDAMHLGDGNILEIPLPRDFALFSLLLKAGAAALFLLLAFPA